MGKIIKGSPPGEGRFTVAMPVTFAAAPPSPELGSSERLGDLDPFDLDRQIGASLPPDNETVTATELAAVRVEAQDLIDDAARTAESLVDDAREQARRIIDEATLQARQLVADARRQGHDEGFAAGTQAAQAEMDGMLGTMHELIAATRGERHAIIAGAEPELVRLAVGIAERVLHQQIALDGSVVVEMAKAAISRIVDREKITVRVNPADIERMREHRDDLLALGDVKTMRVIEDQRVDRGGVIIETDAGSVDAKISTQLTEVRKILHIVDDVVVAPGAIPLVEDPAISAACAS